MTTAVTSELSPWKIRTFHFAVVQTNSQLWPVKTTRVKLETCQEATVQHVCNQRSSSLRSDIISNHCFRLSSQITMPVISLTSMLNYDAALLRWWFSIIHRCCCFQFSLHIMYHIMYMYNNISDTWLCLRLVWRGSVTRFNYSACVSCWKSLRNKFRQNGNNCIAIAFSIDLFLILLRYFYSTMIVSFDNFITYNNTLLI